MGKRKPKENVEENIRIYEARRKRAMAEKLEIENRVRRGELVERAAVAEVLEGALVELRVSLTDAIRRLARRAPDAQACEQAWSQEIATILDAFASRLGQHAHAPEE